MVSVLSSDFSHFLSSSLSTAQLCNCGRVKGEAFVVHPVSTKTLCSKKLRHRMLKKKTAKRLTILGAWPQRSSEQFKQQLSHPTREMAKHEFYHSHCTAHSIASQVNILAPTPAPLSPSQVSGLSEMNTSLYH